MAAPDPSAPLLIKNAKIVDPNSDHHLKKVDLTIEDGVIKGIGKNLPVPRKATVFEAKRLHVSPGWFDMQCALRDPGLEYKEDLISGTQAAAAGGFTGIATTPDTEPVTNNKAGIEYQLNKTQGSLVDVHPFGSVGSDEGGLAELYDMNEAGAIGFTAPSGTIANPQLLKLALQYTKPFGGLIIQYPRDLQVNGNGQMHEGIRSTAMGLKGMPEMAEEIGLYRDLKLANYADQKIHFSPISTTGAIDLIKKAKKEREGITAGVCSYNLLLDDGLLDGFDSHYKLDPPLRTTATIKGLIKGLKDGTIDVVVSAHQPENIENKYCEFEQASFGMINLQTSFALMNTALAGQVDLSTMVEKISINPRNILGLPQPSITKGRAANITLFDPELQWSLERDQVQSRSMNTPLIGRELTGKALGVYNNGQLFDNR